MKGAVSVAKEMKFKPFEKQMNTYEVDDVVCPYCGAVQDDRIPFDQDESGDTFTIECENQECKKGFLMTPILTFTTARMDEDECKKDDRPL